MTPCLSGKVDVGAGANERGERVGVVASAVTEDDRLDQGGPAQIIHMIERATCRDQHANDLRVSQMGGGNQRRPVIAAGDRAGIAAAVERNPQHRHVVGDRGDGDDVVAVDLQRLGIGAEPQQRARRFVLLLIDGDMQRRPLPPVDRFSVRAGCDKTLDCRDVARSSGRVQTGI